MKQNQVLLNAIGQTVKGGKKVEYTDSNRLMFQLLSPGDLLLLIHSISCLTNYTMITEQYTRRTSYKKDGLVIKLLNLSESFQCVKKMALFLPGVITIVTKAEHVTWWRTAYY